MFGFSDLISAEKEKPKEDPKTSIADRELHKRKLAVDEGQTLLLKGDEAYKNGNFKDAVDAYAGASALLLDTPTTTPLRESALQRYAQASVELSKELTRKGQLQDARTVLETVLAKEAAPNDPLALSALEKLEDPIGANPALNGEHAKNVDQVRRLLYLGQGAYDLGKFDESKRHYNDVLKIDSHNVAARRGMEKVIAEQMKYYRSAYDQGRNEYLLDVDREWEIQVKPDSNVPVLPSDTGMVSQNQVISLKNKLSRIIIPQFTIEEGNVTEAIELLRLRASENDNLELVPAMKGINVTTNLGDPESSEAKRILEHRFSIRVSNVPLETLLKYITEASGTSYRYDDFAVTISRKGAAGDSLVSRTYRVPPDFLSNLSAGAKAENIEDDDIFNSTPDRNEQLAKRMGAQEALAQMGVSFPAGASANFNPSTNTLLVVNTMSNQDIIEQIINSAVETEPVIVTLKMKMVKVEKTTLEELGYDWMLNDFSLSGNSSYLSGGTVSNAGPINDFPDFDGNPAAVNPITAGNRTGDFAFSNSNLDQFLAAGLTRNNQQLSRAPGVIGFSGIVNDTTLQMMMRGLDQKKAADMMACPAISTRSGQAASISIIREFIYPIAYDPPEIPQSVGGNNIDIFDDDGNFVETRILPAQATVVPAFPSDYDVKDTGIFLEVLPTVDDKRQFVEVALKPSITDLEGFVNYGSPINLIQDGQSLLLAENPILMPVFSAKKIDTSVVVADGATIVLGGLLKDSVTTVKDKTPILGDIPMVGRFFQSEGVKRNSTAILFFLTVELTDPTGKPYRKR
jgi:general secretion pathway protein D